MEADFSGYATKAGLKCTDGRTIMPDAFAHQDKQRVPLVWQHSHDTPTNVLGYAILEHRADGVYAYGFFNDTPEAKHTKTLVEHGDVVSLSIYANGLRERNKQVMHGQIQELSVVLSGANPGALIDQVRLAHGEGANRVLETLEDEAVIYTGLSLEHGSLKNDEVSHADGDDTEGGRTLVDVLDELTEEQMTAVNYVIEAALQEQADSKTVKHSDVDSTDTESADDNQPADDSSTDAPESTDTPSDDDPDAEGTEPNASQAEDAESKDDIPPADNPSTDAPETEGHLAHQEGNTSMTRNVFDQAGSSAAAEGNTLTHDQFSTILEDARKPGMSLKTSVLAHAAEYGIEDIAFLFPDAKAFSNNPELHARRMEWVAKVLDGTKHTPFAKVRSTFADLTAEEARAKGYVKGNKKVDEVIRLLRRSTGPATIYKKQRLDRDDVLDITDMDVVAFLKAEMRLMLEEEIARAILVGDGRSALSSDKVKDPEGALDGTGIRSILNDSDFYSVKHELTPNVAPKEAVKGLVRARAKYRGTGKPTLFVSDNFLTDIMLEEDKFGRPLYETEQSLRDKLRVESIVTVDLFDEYPSLLGIMVNLADYSIGANRGGELTSFEDFDIDFNQYKYLQETRLSGALTKAFSAVVVTRGMGTKATPAAPSFNGATNTITVPNTTGVVYTANGEPVSAGDLVITETTEIEAVADEGYYLPSNTTKSWTFTYTG